MKISDKSIDEVLRKSDIVSVVEGYIRLKKSGKSYIGLCPFHKEKTPSFTISREKGLYHCFGCKAGGSVVDFIMKMENYSFPEAVEYLAKMFNVKLDYEGVSSQLQDEELEKLYEYSFLAAEYFYDKLFNSNEGHSALKYLIDRGIQETTIKTFRIGYALSAWDGLVNFIQSNNYKLDIFEKLGLIIKKENGDYYDRFRGRIIFPIYSSSGRVIAFGGRTLLNEPEQPKYMNSPETRIYTKGKTLFGLFHTKDEIRKNQAVILVEGYMDFLSLYQYGIKNVVASAGTALTFDQIYILQRIVPNINLVFDGDEAGQKASIRAIDLLLQTDVNFKITSLPENEDPDSFIKKFGVNDFNKLVLNGKNYIDYVYSLAEKNNSLSDSQTKIKVVNSLIEYTAKVKDPIRREVLAKDIAARFKLTPSSVLQKLNRVLQNYEKIEEHQQEIKKEGEYKKQNTVSYTELSPVERGILKLICEIEYDYLGDIMCHIEKSDFINPLAGEVYDFMKRYYLELKKSENIDSMIIMNKLEKEELRSVLSDALVEHYKISDNWEEDMELKENGESIKEIDQVKIKKLITDYIKNLKILSLQKKIDELNQMISETQDTNEVSSIFRELDKLLKEIKYYQDIFKV